MRISTYLANRLETMRLQVVGRIDDSALRLYLSGKQLKNQTSEVDASVQINKYGWQEAAGGFWGSVPPKFELEINERHGFLLCIYAQVYKREGSLPLARAQLLLVVDLHLAGVISFESMANIVQSTNPTAEQNTASRMLMELQQCQEDVTLPNDMQQVLQNLAAAIDKNQPPDDLFQPSMSRKVTDHERSLRLPGQLKP